MSQPIHSLVRQIDKKIKSLRLKRNTLIIDTVNTCKHPKNNLFRYNKSGGAPWIVCDMCGLAEQEWYCGCTKFRKHQYSNIPEIDSDSFLEKVTLLMYNDQHIKYKGKIPYDILSV